MYRCDGERTFVILKEEENPPKIMLCVIKNKKFKLLSLSIFKNDFFINNSTFKVEAFQFKNRVFCSDSINIYSNFFNHNKTTRGF